MTPEALPDDDREFLYAAARDHQEDAQAWLAAFEKVTGVDLDELRRTMRADLADRILSDEWEARQEV